MSEPLQLPVVEAPAKARTSRWAIWALVLGGLGMCCFPVGLVGAGLGITALVKLEKDPGTTGKGFAIAGLAIGVLSVVFNGIFAALAIPAFVGYTRRAKTMEATSSINTVYAGLQARYAKLGRIEPVPLTPATIPCGTAHTWTSEELARFAALAFLPVTTNFSYEVVPAPPDVPDADAVIRAHGDLDCDGITSLFELSIRKEGEHDLTRPRGLYIQNEIE